MDAMIRRNNPKTIRFSWLRAARGRTKVERAEESVRITVSNPSKKTRIWIKFVKVNMGGIINQDALHCDNPRYRRRCLFRDCPGTALKQVCSYAHKIRHSRYT